jgi:hypothetical protein
LKLVGDPSAHFVTDDSATRRLAPALSDLCVRTARDIWPPIYSHFGQPTTTTEK